MASEIDPHAIATYDLNYLSNSDLTSACDITKIDEKNIGYFDVICGGFPCQAFSKAGKREGFDDKTRGTLFFDIVRIIKEKKPRFILLENVRNLISHDNGNTWKVIKESLIRVGYVISEKPIIISPHNLGIPQLRERVFIPGYFDELNAGKKWIEIEVPKIDKNSLKPSTVLDDLSDNDSSLKISSYEKMVLNAWNDFYQNIDLKVIGFPIWVSELNNKEIPAKIPAWKSEIISKNRELYKRNKIFIEHWLNKWSVKSEKWVPTHRKLEWQAGSAINSIWDGIIQFRPSGVRVKRPTVFPTLVAMVQTPIIGWKKRYISVREAANLQSFDKKFVVDERPQQAFKQFGNSVNVEVVKYVFKNLIRIYEKDVIQKQSIK